MKRIRLTLPVIVVLIAVAVAIIVSTSGASTTTARSGGSAISLKQTSLGNALVDANGRTLYLFAGDKRGVSRLSAAGLAVWPPFTSTTLPQATGGVAAAELGTATDVTGGTQLAYNGHPLYYYVGDHQPGQTLGQGLNEFGGHWYAISANGAAITSAPRSVAPSTPYGSSYPY
jgi:predicted lipoprotein with Yx(FWY)xxD motif